MPAASRLIWELGVGVGSSDREAVGSNNWVVSGRLTPDGAPLVANDMHLDVRVPNTWYRAQLEWPDAPRSRTRDSSARRRHAARLSGARRRQQHVRRLGLHEHLRRLERLRPARRRSRAIRPAIGLRQAGRHSTRSTRCIRIAGEADHHEPVTWTIWGPVLEPDYRGQPRAYRWVAHSSSQLAAAVIPLETARTVLDAFDEANGLGTPGSEHGGRGSRRPHRLDRLRIDPAPGRHRRAAALVVGRWHAPLERLAGRCGVSAPDRSARRPHLDRQRPRRRWRDARCARRRRLRGRIAGDDHSRSPQQRANGSRPADMLDIQLDSRRGVSQPMARSDPADADSGRSSRDDADRGDSFASSSSAAGTDTRRRNRLAIGSRACSASRCPRRC